MADLPVPSRSAPSQTVAIQYQHVEISNHCSLVTPRRTPTTVGAVAPWVQPGTQHEKEHNMDVTELLQQDHRTVEGLFSQYRATQDDATVEQICQELERHTTVEEEIVYPRLAEIDPELEQHAEEEHATAKELIAQIRSRPDNVAPPGRTVAAVQSNTTSRKKNRRRSRLCVNDSVTNSMTSGKRSNNASKS
jgi:iron-sulfur cluster repair protein YtfE (RIC family)